MTSFSGVRFVLFCFALLRFSSFSSFFFVFFRFFAFVEAAALRSIVPRYAGAPIVTRFFSFSFFSFCLLGDVAFSEYFFCTIFFGTNSAFSLNGEYVIPGSILSFPNGVFLPCDHGLDFSGLFTVSEPRLNCG